MYSGAPITIPVFVLCEKFILSYLIYGMISPNSSYLLLLKTEKLLICLLILVLLSYSYVFFIFHFFLLSSAHFPYYSIVVQFSTRVHASFSCCIPPASISCFCISFASARVHPPCLLGCLILFLLSSDLKMELAFV